MKRQEVYIKCHPKKVTVVAINDEKEQCQAISLNDFDDFLDLVFRGQPGKKEEFLKTLKPKQ